MVKVKFKGQEIDVDTFDDFFENYFDKSLLNETNTIFLTRIESIQNGSPWYIHYYYLENAERRKSFSNNLQQGDLIGVCSKMLAQYSGRYSN